MITKIAEKFQNQASLGKRNLVTNYADDLLWKMKLGPRKHYELRFTVYELSEEKFQGLTKKLGRVVSSTN